MLPMEIVDRVFHIALGEAKGSAFSLDIDDHQYLVTAKHMVQNIDGPTTIQIFRGNNWTELQVELVGHSDVDVSVLAPSTQLTRKEMKLDAAPGGFFAGQDVFFAGFPLDIVGQNIASPFPAPPIKKAVISGAAGQGYKFPFYLDGHVNRGFSGGPVYLQIPGQRQFVVSMIVSSFVFWPDPVYDGEKPSGLHVQQNSGIMQAYNIRNALELISQNPIGLEL